MTAVTNTNTVGRCTRKYAERRAFALLSSIKEYVCCVYVLILSASYYKRILPFISQFTGMRISQFWIKNVKKLIDNYFTNAVIGNWRNKC